MHIFEYQSLGEYLTAVLSEKKARNARFSLRSMARSLGDENPGALSQVLRDKRPLNSNQCEKFIKFLKLSADDKRYFEVLNFKQSLRDREERELCDRILLLLRTVPPADSISETDFAQVSNWYHMAITEMLSLQNFTWSTSAIQGRLLVKISADVIESALADLVQVGILKIQDGKLSRFEKRSIRIAPGKASENIRKFHKEMMANSVEAMEKISVEKRAFRGVTLALGKESYQRAAEIMERAHNEVLALQCLEEASEVYHFASQLFPLTKSESES